MLATENQETDETLAYAESIGITPDYVEAVTRAVRSGELSMAQVAGFTPEECDALFLQAMDLVRQGAYTRAGKVFSFLSHLDRSDPRYYRGLGLVFHCMHEFGWAEALLDIALAFNADDRIALALKAEGSLYLYGKKRAHQRLGDIVRLGARNTDEQLYLDRAQQILGKIRL
jgi:Flp pilus assembly protein TadD